MSFELSVVIPIRNEAPAIAELVREFTDDAGPRGAAPTRSSWSTTAARTRASRSSRGSRRRDPRLRVIRFRRNFGQTAAFAAGFAHARGRLIVTSDGDLQNDPRDIPAMVECIESGYDIVCGWRKDRKDALSRGALPSMLANRLISVGDRRAPARLRLLAEGVPRRGRQAAEAVRRDAPVPAGDRQRAGRRDQRSRGQPPRAAARHVEVRHRRAPCASSSTW